VAETKGREGLLVDFGTGVLRRDRVLVRRSPIAVIFMGHGSRAERLGQFACADEGDPDPFIARCREIAAAVESGDLAKAQRSGVPREILDIEDRALRRLAIAEALAKYGYDPDQPRVPAGSGRESGEWAGANQADANGGIEPVAARTNDSQARKERFVDAHLADAQAAADKLGVPVENILGLSALESGWGEGNSFVTEGNNYFGIHYPAPFATGYMVSVTGVRVATFASYADSLGSFVAISGSAVQGKGNPEEFAAALQNSGKFGIDPNTGSKVSTYVGGVAATIRGVRSVIARRSP
jgi:hypothetical protein